MGEITLTPMGDITLTLMEDITLILMGAMSLTPVGAMSLTLMGKITVNATAVKSAFRSQDRSSSSFEPPPSTMMCDHTHL